MRSLEAARWPKVGVAVCARDAPGRAVAEGALIVGTLLVVVPGSTRCLGALMLGGERYAIVGDCNGSGNYSMQPGMPCMCELRCAICSGALEQNKSTKPARALPPNDQSSGLSVGFRRRRVGCGSGERAAYDSTAVNTRCERWSSSNNSLLPTYLEPASIDNPRACYLENDFVSHKQTCPPNNQPLTLSRLRQCPHDRCHHEGGG